MSELAGGGELYRYDEDGDGEVPIDDHNHALAALRYLISGLDGNGGVWRRKRPKTEEKRAEVPWWRRPEVELMWTPR